MIDLSKIKYRVAVMDEAGNQYNIKDFIQNLGWEENENEISVRSSFTVRNDKTSKGYLSSIIRPGCLVGIFATDGGSLDEEVARGYVETWNPIEKNSGNNLKCTCYDELYRLQKSQDNRYYPSGTGTKSVLQGIFDDWGIPQGDYYGPNVSHGKTACNKKYLSDIMLEFLDDAVKKGGEKCMIKAAKGYTSVVPWGSNETVYVFEVDNTRSFSQTISTTNLITRVKVIGQADDDGKRSVDATLNGETQYGIRQRIYTRGSDETLSDANSAAQAILDGEGGIEREMTVQSPDVPFIRKGDLVYIMSSFMSDYYYVKGIQHNADTYSMSMELRYAGMGQEAAVVGGRTADPAPSPETAPDPGGQGGGSKRRKYKVGDIVSFHGGPHYVSSYAGTKGHEARAGEARIVFMDGLRKAHPWYLVHTDSDSDVYGWVDSGSFD